uniref:Atpase inhibitor n=1 Tax=Ornithodoros turicata TaxID=34597 RepID=A0A2R5LE12_9ACAR
MSQAGHQPGSGTGKGGGSGGSIREAGGGLGRMGAAKEEQHFRNVQQQQLDAIRKGQEEAKTKDTQKSGT